MEAGAAAGGAFRASRATSGRELGPRRFGPSAAPFGPIFGIGIGLLDGPQDADEGQAPTKGKRGRRRNQRPLFRAEQVMEKKKQPKKKYLATQRIRRDVERAQAESLALDVNFLKQEIADLETVRSILQANRLAGKVTSVCNLMAVVHEYFGKIQYGFGRETPASAITLANKIDFLRAVFDENLDFGTGRGRDAFIAQCQGYTLFHAFFFYEAPVLTQVSPKNDDHSIIIVARNRLRVRVSRQTIEVMFPHLMQDEVMVQALIGSELIYPCVITVYFDQRGRVVRHDADVDFVSGLTAALKSLNEVSRVLDSARLDGSIIVYDKSRPHTKDPPLTTAKTQRPPAVVIPPVDERFSYVDEEEKCPPQPQDEPSPVHTPTTSEGVANKLDRRQLYASPPASHAHFAAANSSEFEAAAYLPSHPSPSKQPARQSKESVASRMSIHSLLS
jgi:hypothetical protein